MDYSKDSDADTFLSLSNDSLDNATEVVETESSHVEDRALANLTSSYKKYELNSFPLDSDPRLKRGTIHSIEIYNFKSYLGNVFIDNLSSFNAIVGPNGSGKSNLMDAISFVLCIRTSTLRGNNLKDLINKNPDPKDPLENRFAYVALTLKGDNEYSVFKRLINSKGHISYIHNNNVITFKGYIESLNEYKINTLSSTGLIFQNSVNEIIVKLTTSSTSLELTKLFELISGSVLYEKPYNYIKNKLDKIRTEYKNLSLKKKQLSKELKQFRFMKNLNQKYQSNLQELNETKLSYYCYKFNIYHYKFSELQSTYNNLVDDYDEVLKKLDEVNSKKLNLEDKLTNLYYKQSQLNRSIQHKNDQLNLTRNSMNEYFMSKTNLESKLDVLSSLKTQIAEEEFKLNEELDKLVKSKEDLEEEMGKLEKQLETLEKDKVKLTKEQLDEFNESLKSFNNSNFNLNLITTNLKQNKSQISSVEKKIKSTNSQIEQLNLNLNKNKSLIESMELKLKDYKDGLETVMLRVRKLTNDKSELLEFREELTSKKDFYENKLKSLNILKHEHNQLMKKSMINNEMSKVVEGVYGEVMSLFEVTNESYYRPIMSALGNRANTIVTRNHEVITKCIEYLKDNRLGRREFLSLDTLERMEMSDRDKSGKRRLITNYMRRVYKINYLFVIDSIEFDPEFEVLFEYLVGDTVIVSSLDDAEKILTSPKSNETGGNTKELKFNIVTQSSQLITRDRTIVIGSSLNYKGSQLQMEILQYNKYTNLLSDVEKEISSSMDREKSITKEIEDNTLKIEKYKRAIELTHMKLQFMSTPLNTLKMQLKQLEEDRETLKEELQKHQRSMRENEKELEKENKKLNKLKIDHFKELNEKFGTDDIYELMMTHGESYNTITSSLKDNQNTLTRYNLDIKDIQNKINTLHEKVNKTQEEVDATNKELEKLKNTNMNNFNELESLQSELSNERSLLEGVLSEIEDCNRDIRNLMNNTNMPRDTTEVLSKINEHRTEMLNLYKEALNLVEYCKINNINLQFSTCTPSNTTNKDSNDSSQGELSIEDNLNLNNIDKIDFTNLEFPKLINDDFDMNNNVRTMERELESLENKMKVLEKSLNSLRSYTDVENKVEVAEAELSIIDRECESVKVQLNKLESDFESIRRERSGLFLHCFQTVKDTVGPIYRKLSSLEGGSEGQAFLSLDEITSSIDTEPFNCSIRYNTIPPMKKYLDLNLQSGGEKAISSIALLLALHNYRGSPFVVLDEIDANIDAIKLKNLTQYLMDSDFQVIIISLKEKLFSKAQKLIGVYRSHPSFASRCLVLNLEDYEDDNEDN